MIKDKKQCKVIARVTPELAFHILRRTRDENKTQSELIRELISKDKEAYASEGALSFKAIHKSKKKQL